MQFNGTAVLERTEAAQVSPVIEGPKWFDAEPDSWTVRMHVPVTPDLMVAALMFGATAEDDLTPDVPDIELWGLISAAIVAEGFLVVEGRSAELKRDEAAGRLTPFEAGHLANVRRRVEGMTAR